MVSNENNVAVKHLMGKLSNHFIFKLSVDGKVDYGNKFTSFTATSNFNLNDLN